MDDQVVIAIVMGFSMFVSLLPIVLLGYLPMKACGVLVLGGIALVLTDTLPIMFVEDVSFTKAVILNFQEGTNSVMIHYGIGVAGVLLAVAAIIRTIILENSKPSAGDQKQKRKKGSDPHD